MFRFACISMLIVSASAQAQLYQRVDPITGHVTYTNRPPPGHETDATPAPQLQTSNRPNRTGKSRASQRQESEVSTPATFPRINAAEQKQRDLDRRAILTDELRSEVQALERLGVKPSDYQAANRHRQNIASLERELANLR